MIQQSTGYHKRNHTERGLRERDELELQSLSGGFRRSLRNQNPVDQRKTMQSQPDLTTNQRKWKVRNSLMERAKDETIATVEISKFMEMVPAKPIPQVDSSIILGLITTFSSTVTASWCLVVAQPKV